ncbi:hypothetical protein QJQ45_002979 [Haematococcus lacustris]|nr:hypothetical protein QJQ45_002979 [Haematococcus lacustris]
MERQKEAGVEAAEEESIDIPPPRPKRKPARPYPRSTPALNHLVNTQQASSVAEAPGVTMQLSMDLGGASSSFTNMESAGFTALNAGASMTHTSSLHGRHPNPLGTESRLHQCAKALGPSSTQQRSSLMNSQQLDISHYNGALLGGSRSNLQLPTRPHSSSGARPAVADPTDPYHPPSTQQLQTPLPGPGAASLPHTLAQLTRPCAGGAEAASGEGEVSEATLAAVAAAASAAAAAAAAAVVAAAGHHVQAHLQAHPFKGFPFFGMSPAALACMSLPGQPAEALLHSGVGASSFMASQALGTLLSTSACLTGEDMAWHQIARLSGTEAPRLASLGLAPSNSGLRGGPAELASSSRTNPPTSHATAAATTPSTPAQDLAAGLRPLAERGASASLSDPLDLIRLLSPAAAQLLLSPGPPATTPLLPTPSPALGTQQGQPTAPTPQPQATLGAQTQAMLSQGSGEGYAGGGLGASTAAAGSQASAAGGLGALAESLGSAAPWLFSSLLHSGATTLPSALAQHLHQQLLLQRQQQQQHTLHHLLTAANQVNGQLLGQPAPLLTTASTSGCHLPTHPGGAAAGGYGPAPPDARHDRNSDHRADPPRPNTQRREVVGRAAEAERDSRHSDSQCSNDARNPGQDGLPLPSLQPPPHRLQLVALEGRREAQLALEAGEVLQPSPCAQPAAPAAPQPAAGSQALGGTLGHSLWAGHSHLLPLTDTRLPTTAAPLPCHLAPARSARAPSQSLSVSTTPAESPAFASDALALSLLLAATGMHPTPSAELPPADEGAASGQAAGGTALAHTLAKAAGAGAGGAAGAASSQCSAGSQEGCAGISCPIMHRPLTHRREPVSAAATASMAADAVLQMQAGAARVHAMHTHSHQTQQQQQQQPGQGAYRSFSGGLPGSSSVGSAGGGGGGPAKPHGVIKPQARRHALAAASVHNLHRMADPGQLPSAGSLPPNLAGLTGLGCWGEVASDQGRPAGWYPGGLAAPAAAAAATPAAGREGPGEGPGPPPAPPPEAGSGLMAAGPLGLLGTALGSKGGAGGQPNKPELSTGVSEPAGPGVKSSGPSMGRSGGAVEGGLRPADTEGGGPYGGHGEDLGSVGDDERGGDEAVCGRVKAGKVRVALCSDLDEEQARQRDGKGEERDVSGAVAPATAAAAAAAPAAGGRGQQTREGSGCLASAELVKLQSAAVDAFFSGASGGGGKGQGQQGQVQAHSHSQGLRLYKGRSGGKTSLSLSPAKADMPCTLSGGDPPATAAGPSPTPHLGHGHAPGSCLHEACMPPAAGRKLLRAAPHASMGVKASKPGSGRVAPASGLKDAQSAAPAPHGSAMHAASAAWKCDCLSSSSDEECEERDHAMGDVGMSSGDGNMSGGNIAADNSSGNGRGGNFSGSSHDGCGNSSGNDGGGNSSGNDGSGNSSGNDVGCGNSSGNDGSGNSSGNDVGCGNSSGNDGGGNSSGNDAGGASGGNSNTGPQGSTPQGGKAAGVDGRHDTHRSAASHQHQHMATPCRGGRVGSSSSSKGQPDHGSHVAAAAAAAGTGSNQDMEGSQEPETKLPANDEDEERGKSMSMDNDNSSGAGSGNGPTALQGTDGPDNGSAGCGLRCTEASPDPQCRPSPDTQHQGSCQADEEGQAGQSAKGSSTPHPHGRGSRGEGRSPSRLCAGGQGNTPGTTRYSGPLAPANLGPTAPNTCTSARAARAPDLSSPVGSTRLTPLPRQQEQRQQERLAQQQQQVLRLGSQPPGLSHQASTCNQLDPSPHLSQPHRAAAASHVGSRAARHSHTHSPENGSSSSTLVRHLPTSHPTPTPGLDKGAGRPSAGSSTLPSAAPPPRHTAQHEAGSAGRAAPPPPSCQGPPGAGVAAEAEAGAGDVHLIATTTTTQQAATALSQEEQVQQQGVSMALAAALVVPAPVAGAAEEAVAAAAAAAGCAAGATAAGSTMDAAVSPVSPAIVCQASTRPGHGGLLAVGFEPGTCHVVARAHLTDLGSPAGDVAALAASEAVAAASGPQAAVEPLVGGPGRPLPLPAARPLDRDGSGGGADPLGSLLHPTLLQLLALNSPAAAAAHAPAEPAAGSRELGPAPTIGESPGQALPAPGQTAVTQQQSGTAGVLPASGCSHPPALAAPPPPCKAPDLATAPSDQPAAAQVRQTAQAGAPHGSSEAQAGRIVAAAAAKTSVEAAVRPALHVSQSVPALLPGQPSRMGSSFNGCGPYLAPQDALTALLHAGGLIAEGQEQEELSHLLLSGLAGGLPLQQQHQEQGGDVVQQLAALEKQQQLLGHRALSSILPLSANRCMSQQLPTGIQGQGEELRGGEAGAGGTRSSWGGVVKAEGSPWPLFRSSGSNLKVLGGSGTLSVELTPPGWPRGDDSQPAVAAAPGSEDAVQQQQQHLGLGPQCSKQQQQHTRHQRSPPAWQGQWGPCASDLDVVDLDADTDHVLRHKSCSSSELHHQHQLPLSGPGPAQPPQQALPTHAPLCEAPWQTQPNPGLLPLGLLSTMLSGVGRHTLDRLHTAQAPPYPSTLLADRAESNGLVGMAGVEGPGSHGAAANAQRPLPAAHPTSTSAGLPASAPAAPAASAGMLLERLAAGAAAGNGAREDGRLTSEFSLALLHQLHMAQLQQVTEAQQLHHLLSAPGNLTLQQQLLLLGAAAGGEGQAAWAAGSSAGKVDTPALPGPDPLSRLERFLSLPALGQPCSSPQQLPQQQPQQQAGQQPPTKKRALQ